MDTTVVDDKWKETREFLGNVTRSFEITLDSAEYLQRTGREYVRRYSRVIKCSEPPAPTGTLSSEFRETKQKSDTRSDEWRKLLFQKSYPVEFENESHWYKVLQRHRPCRSLYDGLGMFTPAHVVKVDACVQTDFTFVRKCFLLGMESFEKEEKTSGIWTMCCCGRQ
ncbi:uncharacterized protein LOC110452481 [Mizuhopecten yessoensis]|uniref:Uncharacterized protein n=1 Tax=Mizuhopecten yessoensis TaxID=6573 RepID=A0A210QJG7_MIZYE|nr:uncharacterized protein LOC110452481 [Mizuhopecten yessoensis]OWF48892.1 hypothetical protein KP79_PYT08721 [Mizuhopecten yessoensis]